MTIYNASALSLQASAGWSWVSESGSSVCVQYLSKSNGETGVYVPCIFKVSGMNHGKWCMEYLVITMDSWADSRIVLLQTSFFLISSFLFQVCFIFQVHDQYAGQ